VHGFFGMTSVVPQARSQVDRAAAGFGALLPRQ